MVRAGKRLVKKTSQDTQVCEYFFPFVCTDGLASTYARSTSGRCGTVSMHFLGLPRGPASIADPRLSCNLMLVSIAFVRILSEQ